MNSKLFFCGFICHCSNRLLKQFLKVHCVVVEKKFKTQISDIYNISGVITQTQTLCIFSITYERWQVPPCINIHSIVNSPSSACHIFLPSYKVMQQFLISPQPSQHRALPSVPQASKHGDTTGCSVESSIICSRKRRRE